MFRGSQATFGLTVVAFFLLIVLFWRGSQESRSPPQAAGEAVQSDETAEGSEPEDSAELSEAFAIFSDARKVYQAQNADRIEFLRHVLNKTTRPGWGIADLYNGLVPEVTCPGLVRVGRIGDGGKWMCSPSAMPQKCAVYSLGVNQDTSFERELQNITASRCKIFAYDKNNPRSEKVLMGFDKINAEFTKALVGVEANPDSNKVAIQDEMKKRGQKTIEILKIDIEGAEFGVIPQLLKHTSICQVLVEAHGSAASVLRLLTRMAQGGFRLFSYEINGLHHHLAEYSLIHDDCIEKYGAVPLANFLDQL